MKVPQVALGAVQEPAPVPHQVELLPGGARRPHGPDLEQVGARQRCQHGGVRRAEHLAARGHQPLEHGDQAQRGLERQRRLGLVEAVEAGRLEPGLQHRQERLAVAELVEARLGRCPTLRVWLEVGVPAVHRLGPQEEPPAARARDRAGGRARRPAVTRSAGWCADCPSTRPRGTGRTPSPRPRRSSTCPIRSRRPGRSRRPAGRDPTGRAGPRPAASSATGPAPGHRRGGRPRAAPGSGRSPRRLRYCPCPPSPPPSRSRSTTRSCG